MEPDILKTWSLEWPVFDVLISGQSSIDLDRLPIHSLEEAQAFIKTYGYNLSQPGDEKKIHSIFIEAINFISEFLIPAEWEKGIKPPRDILDRFDIPNLLYQASLNPSTVMGRWSCAILRVMHTIAHIDDVQRLLILEAAKEQILAPFQALCFRDEQNRLWFGTQDQKVELSKVEWKASKSRNSMILKLLHKPANVSETIYDLIGIRMITYCASDILLILKYLCQMELISFPNINPTRSRNTLISLDGFKKEIEKILQLKKQGQTPDGVLIQKIKDISQEEGTDKKLNPHSSDEFQSIQITCRQRVRYKEPVALWKEKVRSNFKKLKPEDPLSKLIQSLDSFYKDLGASMEHGVFFPFELQLIDLKTAKKIEAGPASHAKYKKSQIRTAKKRILQDIVKLHKETTGS
jgi:uncharacterized protein (TIGR04562 family)